MPSERTPRTLVALAAVALSLPVATGVAGALPAEPPPEWETAELVEIADEPAAELMPAHGYPDVPGVDLLALGYQGEPLDADVLARIDAPVPEGVQPKIDELSVRLLLGTAQRDGLVEARGLLRAVVDDLAPEADALRARLAVAERHESDGVQRVAEAETRLGGREAELTTHREDMAQVAVAAYVSPPDADVLAQVLGGAATTTSDLSAEVLFTAKADHDSLVRDELEVSIAVAKERLTDAQAMVATATTRTEATAKALTQVQARLDAHRRALGLVETALEQIEAQLPPLKVDLDRTIEEEWRRVEAELEAQLAAQEAALALDITALAGVPTTTVKGIRIHPALAHRLNALLEHAHADGVPLGGWGHRTTQSQIELRRKHCGPTPEDIYLKDPGACSPPTARPGRSMHERGLAVDFHLAGRSISSHSSPGYQWLAQHAATYGFYNLPSEPWHWSVNAK